MTVWFQSEKHGHLRADLELMIASDDQTDVVPLILLSQFSFWHISFSLFL